MVPRAELNNLKCDYWSFSSKRLPQDHALPPRRTLKKAPPNLVGGGVVKALRRIFPPIAHWLMRCTSPRNRGICVVGKPIRAANSDIPRGIKPGATPRRRTWHKAGQKDRTTPTH